MRHQAMLPCLRSAVWVLLLSTSAAGLAFAQDATPQLVFTVGVPERTPSTATLQVSTSVEERALAMWRGSASDFGVAVALSRTRWTLRSIASMTALPVDGHRRPNLRQIEIVRHVYSSRSLSVAGGGGIREEWDGTRTLIGRVLGGSDFGRGRLEGSLVIERASSPRLRRDAADVITTIGWSRPISDRLSLGVESIGQDLEGLWDPAEADGGARLLVGPSLRARSKHRAWTASVIAGPVVQKVPRLSASEGAMSPSLAGGHHFGIFVSANWVPSLHR